MWLQFSWNYFQCRVSLNKIIKVLQSMQSTITLSSFKTLPKCVLNNTIRNNRIFYGIEKPLCKKDRNYYDRSTNVLYKNAK